MGKDNFLQVSQTLNAGLNQQANMATADECSDCRNVWAPNGEVEARPGLVYVDSFHEKHTAADGSRTTVAEFADGRFLHLAGGAYGANGDGDVNLDLTGFGANPKQDRLYFYTTTPSVGPDNYAGFRLSFANGGSPILAVGTEYYNGTRWVWIPSAQRPDSAVVGFGQDGIWQIQFRPPSDWASTTINGVTGYFMRMYVAGSDDSSVDGEGEPDPDTTIYSGTELEEARWLIGYHDAAATQAATISAKSYTTPLSAGIVATTVYQGGTATLVREGVPGRTILVDSVDDLGSSTRPTFAVVQSTNDMFIAYGQQVYYYSLDDGYTTSLTKAVPDARDASIGRGAPWDATTRVLTHIPRANLVAMHRNRLWFADIDGDPRLVQWSAAAPYHRVIPALAHEYLEGGQSERPTGLYSYGPELIVTEPDEIWRMVFVTLDPSSVPLYVPTPLGVGIGCVSGDTIQTCNGRMVFLSEQGICSYDGQKVKLVSTKTRGGVTYDRLSKFWPTLGKGSKWRSCAVNWSSKGCYLLAVSTSGSAYNDKIVCWDYTNDSFWIWDSPESGVASFLSFENGDGSEQVYIVDQFGDVLQFVGSNTKDGVDEFEASITTHRVGQSAHRSMRYRECVVTADSSTAQALVTVTRHDNSSAKAVTLDYRDVNETEWVAAGLTFPATLVDIREREKVARVRLTGSTFKVKISNNSNGKQFGFRSITHRFLPLGTR